MIAHGSTTLPVCVAATTGTSTPFVYRSIGDPAYWVRGRAQRARTGALLRRARAVVVVWRGAADQLVHLYGVRPERIHHVANGVVAKDFPLVDADRRRRARVELGLRDDARVVLFLGALSAEKNVEAAIDAVAAIEDAHLLVVGDGPSRVPVEALARTRLPGRHTFTGTTDVPARALAAADVLVLPSRSEGCPGALIEAGLSGLPVVATDVGGVAEVVVDGRTGRLVQPGSTSELASALREVLADPGDLGPAARAHCLEHFELDHVATQWADLVGRLVA